MNKKVDEEFKYVHDEYILQCTCTEMKDKINNLQSKIDKANELIEENKDQVDWLHMPAWELENILKENK